MTKGIEQDQKPSELAIALPEFAKIINAIYGVYLDSYAAFTQLRLSLIQSQQQACAQLGLSIEEIDERGFAYSEEHPSKLDAFLHVASQKEIKKRNEKDGQNQRFSANMCLIAIYSYWEDTYRGRFADALNKDRSEITADVFGDIRLLRNDIIHKRGIVVESAKCKLLKWFESGEEISISSERFKEMIYRIKEYLLSIRNQFLPTVSESQSDPERSST